MGQILRLVTDQVGRQSHHGRQPLGAIALQQLIRHLEAGHIRQLDIQQQEIKPTGLDQLQRLGATARRGHRMTELLEQGSCHRDVQLHVFEQQDPQIRRGMARLRLRLVQTLHRQLQHEATAMALLAVDRQGAPHGLHQLTRDRQPNPGTYRMLLAVDLVIHGEDVFQLAGRNADPGIFHLEPQRQLSWRLGDQVDPQRHPTMLGELDGVAGQIPQHLPQPGAIGLHPMGQITIQIEVQIEPLLLGHQPGQRLQIAEKGRQVHPHRGDLQPMPVDLVQIDDVIEDITQGHGADVDGIQILALLGIQPGLLQDTAQADDAIERGSQLVADGRDEGGLLPAGLLQLLLVPLPFGHIAAEAQHPQTLAARVEEGHLAHLEAGRVAIGIDHPLLIGARSVAGKDLLIGLLDPGGDLR